MNIIHTIGILFDGGPLMYVMLVLLLVAITVIVERFYFLHSVLKTGSSFSEEIKSILKTDNGLKKAKEYCDEHPGIYSSLLSVGLNNLCLSKDERDEVLTEEAMRHTKEMERYMWVLDTLITMAPLLGLLGTIIGIMISFNVISKTGVSHPTAITGGVALALLNTAAGLVIAILCLGFFNYFQSKIISIKKQMEYVVLQFENFISKNDLKDNNSFGSNQKRIQFENKNVKIAANESALS
ncbi:MAG: MotA/TolQ/ExbB proton channel family protein [Deltaproteobacteria bacterium]|jgi:biopolymer transport protein ExbB|uniref:MotA/TolQ/ExbB proton channel family protein n=1 Tax=Candidatus Acidulodesulfobacterium acidiphilum TaxID=2597224 RepID=A0A520X710_9DELT|nr:MotA/TolQ/ExbB proton channel family protein [Deltaproteobacteria bacterium]MCL6120230.1 MotA/TolQ/ExbB proton channel family protein [Deltaproteobacteria bacterium]RZV36997.1 MAG: MotA/TolQ/ExbB proton channel family protein [Candidatus Acidulodesulfobacterium acidiphilum]